MLTMEAEDSRTSLAIRTVVAVIGAGAALAGPDVGTVLTVMSPALEEGLGRIYERLSSGRYRRAAETLTDAADAAGANTAEEFLAFIEGALSSDERQELLARVLLIAQDTSARNKRRALGRALASALADNGTRVDEELVYIRILDDLDTFHIRLLKLMTGRPERLGNLQADVRPWMLFDVTEADTGLAGVEWSLMTTLERHGLVWSTSMEDPEYSISQHGEWFLTRLTDEPSGRS
jgi:hypothetical protein